MYKTDAMDESFNLKICLRKTIYNSNADLSYMQESLLRLCNARSVDIDGSKTTFKLILNQPIESFNLELAIENSLKDLMTKEKNSIIKESGVDNYKKMINPAMIKFLYSIIPFTPTSYIIKL